MGLLDFSGFVGDETVKDEYGMTQADRRQPLFTGLLKAGMLGMAAGENITPGQRAQLMGQIGGAIGDIPEARNRQMAEAAQMQIRRQQFQEGARKNADRERIRAYAQTPDFQEAIKAADPAERLAIQAAVDSGDIGALNTAVGNIGKADLRQQGLAIQEQRLQLARDKAEGQKTGGMAGTGERQQFQTWLMTEPPDSQRYARAHAYFSSEQRHNENGVWITQPAQDLKSQGYPDPTFAGRGGTVGGPWPPPDAPPAGGRKKDPETGLVTETSADGKTVTQTDPTTGVQTIREQGKPEKKVTPKPVDPAKVAKFESAERNALVSIRQLQKFRDLSKNASGEERLKALAGSSLLNTAYGLSTMIIKGEALLELGVLNGGDMDRIREILADPRTFKGSVADYEKQVEEIIDLVEYKLDIHRKQTYGDRPPPSPAGPKPAGPKGTTPIGTGNNGQPLYRWSDGQVYESPEP